jgi:hypothetical protein
MAKIEGGASETGVRFRRRRPDPGKDVPASPMFGADCNPDLAI